MAIVPMSEAGATEVETLAKSLQKNSEEVTKAGDTLIKVVGGNKEGLGVFAKDIEDAVTKVKQQQNKAATAIETIATKLTSLAAEIREAASSLG